MTPRFAPPRRAALFLAGVGQISRRVQRQSSPQFRAADTLILIRAVPVRLIGLPPLVLIISLQIPHVVLRWRRRAEINAPHTLNSSATSVPFFRTAAAPSAISSVIRFHVIDRVGER